MRTDLRNTPSVPNENWGLDDAVSDVFQSYQHGVKNACNDDREDDASNAAFLLFVRRICSAVWTADRIASDFLAALRTIDERHLLALQGRFEP